MFLTFALGIVVDDRRKCPQGGVVCPQLDWGKRTHEKPDPQGNVETSNRQIKNQHTQLIRLYPTKLL